MSSANIDHTLSRIEQVGIVAVLRAPDPERALSVIDTLITHGITGIEVTFTTPSAETVIAESIRRHGGDALIGAGTVTTGEQVTLAHDAGAQFLVSPGTDPEVTAAMVATGLVTMTGALTPTEVMSATRLGAHVIKIFPGSLVGPHYLGALRGPFPGLKFMPTGGVSAENLGAWFSAGAFAVGAGSDLVPSSAFDTEDYGQIASRAAQFVQAKAALSSRGGA